jgi:hypothetical protein
VLRHLLACMVHENSSEDLKTKSKRALKAILAKCTHLQVLFAHPPRGPPLASWPCLIPHGLPFPSPPPQALQPLLRDSPVNVQKYVLRQFAQLLPHDVEARRAFVQSGGLQFLQELNETVRPSCSPAWLVEPDIVPDYRDGATPHLWASPTLLPRDVLR